MRGALVIARKDICAAFVTPIAYVVFAGFIFLSGFFFFTLIQQFNLHLAQAALLKDSTPNLNEWVITPYFQTLEIVLLFLIPMLTMRAFASERESGTYELLSTSPVSVMEIVFGKFLGALVVVLLMLLLSFIYPGVLLIYAEPEFMPIVVGFLGLALFAAAFTSLGVAISSTTRSQTVSAAVGLVLFLVFYVADSPARRLPEIPAEILRYLTPSSHTEMLAKGVIDSSHLVYFLSLIVLGQFIANRVLDAERWR